MPLAVQQALESWLKVHPLACGVGLLDEQPLFVRLGRHGHEQPLPLSAVAVHRWCSVLWAPGCTSAAFSTTAETLVLINRGTSLQAPRSRLAPS